MGENRFKTATNLLREKRGPAQDFGQNQAMSRGIRDELEARRRYTVRTGRTVGPVCLQSTRYDWLRAASSIRSNSRQAEIMFRSLS